MNDIINFDKINSYLNITDRNKLKSILEKGIVFNKTKEIKSTNYFISDDKK